MIRIGIVGYGKLGRSVKKAVKASDDMDLSYIFSRRKIESDLYAPFDDIRAYKDKVDLLILCGSSDKDIPSQGPDLLRDFNTLDSFDNHSHIPDYYKKMDRIGRENDRLSVISTGWDPGLFSLERLLGEAILPDGNTFTFWGKGVSQGHSAALRSIDGVADATQYTIPKEEVLEAVRRGDDIDFDSKMAHLRECFVVAKEGADEEKIEEAIKTMPDYFEGYETRVHFITKDELERDHKGLVHGGHVIRTGLASGSTRSTIEFSLDLSNNPDFTAAVDVAYARALYRLYKEGKRGAMTVFDIAPSYLIAKSHDEILGLI